MFTNIFQPPGEKLIVRLDASSLKRASCAQEFFYNNLNGYTRKSTGTAMVFGTAIHKATAALRRGTPLDQAMLVGLDHFLDTQKEPDELRTSDLLLSILDEYLQKRMPTRDTFKSAMRNDKPAIELPFEIPFRAFDDVDFTLCGAYDELGHFSDDVPRFLDIKSTGLMPRKVSGKWRTSQQMLLYSYVAKASGYSTHYPSPVIDMLFIRAKIGARHVRYADDCAVAHEHVDEYMSYVWDKCEEIRGWLQQSKFNLNRACCETVFGECEFRDVCDSTPAIRAGMLKSMFKQREYNPATFGEN